jgi:ribosomal protein S18 acetylase RimI-like enzyme
VLATLDLELPAHQGRSPVFSSGPTATYEEALTGAEEAVDDPDFATFVVERDGRVVGTSVGCALTNSGSHSGLARPDDAGFLGFAAVLPEARGTGAGRAVGDAVLATGAEAGYRSVVTDWRSTNLLSSRTWPRLGFRPRFLRLRRLVGH